jgi:hypothetical protein
MHILLLFLDGVGLGADDPTINPFAAAHTPTLDALAGGARWLAATPRRESARAIFIPTDAQLGIAGRPQSASGQAAIMTGRNVPAEIGEHYGPRPNPAIRAILAEENLFKQLTRAGKRAAVLDAFPQEYFESVARGMRLRGALHQAAAEADVPLGTVDDIRAGRALSADFTGEGWREFLGVDDIPLYAPAEAGAKLAALARQHNFSLFSTFITDEIGHRGPLERGVAFIERFDAVMAGLLAAWHDEDGLIVITSDHGNLENLSIRQHTENRVPTVVIGAARAAFAEGLRKLTDIAPQIVRQLV